MTHELNFEIIREEFLRRYKENQGKQIDNSRSRAGAPMYYYCHGCGVLLATLPESHFGSRPGSFCNSCKVLDDHGMLDRLKKEAEEIAK